MNSWVGVDVPATSANLGPGFDCAGLALEMRDVVRARRCDGPTHVSVTGEGAGQLPTGDRHLVVRALHAGMEAAGERPVPVEVECRNVIPHARGLGSSAAAVVAGLGLAREMLGRPASLNDEALLRIATEMEGHPDNAAPAILGGATLTYVDEAGPHALNIQTAELIVHAWIPAERATTAAARAALPGMVSFGNAAFTVSRAALLPVALARPDLLFAATADQLHQSPRAALMPESARLIALLRDQRVPAVLSGAGPTVLSFGPVDDGAVERAHLLGWRVERLTIAPVGLRAVPVG